MAEKLWGKPPRKQGKHYSGRGEFNSHDAGSVLDNGVWVGVAGALATGVEVAAHEFYPGTPVGAAAVGAWVLQLVIWLALRITSYVFRSFGSSILRYLGELFWQCVADWWASVRDRFSLRGFLRRRRERRDERIIPLPPLPDGYVPPPPPRRQPLRRIWDWLR